MDEKRHGGKIALRLQHDAEFGEGLADKIALPCAWMRERQFRRIDNRSAEVDEVNIDCARAIANGANAAEGIFNRVHSTREVEGIESRFKNRRLVEELLSNKRRRDVNRLRLDDRTRRDKASIRKTRQCIERPLKKPAARLDV